MFCFWEATFLELYEPRVGNVAIEDGEGSILSEGDGSMTTSSACAVCKSFRSLPSVDGKAKSEFNEVHQSPADRRCTRAYLRFLGGDGEIGSAVAARVAFVSPFTTPSVGSGGEGGRIVSRSRGMGVAWNEAWSRSDKARLQKRSCWAAGVDGRDRGWEDIGNRCRTADWQ
jgi:hypothetical protein